MKTKSIGTAFIGAGLVAHMHARAVHACDGAKLIGAYDNDSTRAKALVRQYGGRAYRHLDELLADPHVEAVHVLMPPAGHVAAGLAALKAGKHVLVEKPVANKVGDVLKLKHAAAKHGRVCMPAHNYIYVPSLRRAKRLIEAGKLGRIASFWMLYNMFHSEELIRKYGGIFRVVMTHHAYSLLYLLGRPIRLTAMAFPGVHYKKLKCEGQASITCEMPGGVIANLWASFSGKDLTNDPWNVVYKVLGTKGGVCYSWNEAQFEDATGPGFGLPGYEDGFHGEVDHFINRCIRRGEPPLSSLDDAVDALRIIEAAERAVRNNRGAVQIRYSKRN
jgi:predicted dehydrogenase